MAEPETEKAARAVEEAIAELDGALEAHLQNETGKAKMAIWRASAKTEYALFLLRLRRGGGEKIPEAEDEDAPETVVDVRRSVVKAQELLKKANENLETNLPQVWHARGVLITLQEHIEKGKL